MADGGLDVPDVNDEEAGVEALVRPLLEGAAAPDVVAVSRSRDRTGLKLDS